MLSFGNFRQKYDTFVLLHLPCSLWTGCSGHGHLNLKAMAGEYRIRHNTSLQPAPAEGKRALKAAQVPIHQWINTASTCARVACILTSFQLQVAIRSRYNE